MLMPSRVLGAMYHAYHASPSPLVLPAVVAHAPSPRPSCRELQAISLFQKKQKRNLLAEVFHVDTKHMHDITTDVIATKRQRRVWAGWANHVVDLDLAVARTGPHEVGDGRAAGPLGGPEVGEHASEEIATKMQFLRRAVWVKTERKAKKRDL